MEKRSTSLMGLVEEKALSKLNSENKKKKQQQNAIPYLPKDWISDILVQIPLEYLQQLRFVCKPWYRIINSPAFIDAHRRSSKTVLIFLTEVRRDRFFPYTETSTSQGNSNIFSVESKLYQLSLFDPTPLLSIKFMEIEEGKSKVKEYNATCMGKIRATCNGLIVLDNKKKKGGLIVMNPVTREVTALPLGTLFSRHNESYGFAFCSRENEYKLVHLFRDEMQCVGCEILNLSTRSWRMVDGPSSGFFSWFGYNPVSANGALYWVPHVDYNEYLVSMALHDEKFLKIPLPRTCRSCDKILEMDGLLGLVILEERNRFGLWVLSSSCGEGWRKQYNITVGCKISVIPLYMVKNSGEIIFTDGYGSLYAYDTCLQVTREIEVENECFALDGCYLPHVNSLVSWKMPAAEGQPLDD